MAQVVDEVLPVAPSSAQALQEMGYRLAARYHHELRNPLQTIQGAVALLRSRVTGVDGDLLDTIERNVSEITDILNERMVPASGAAVARLRLSEIVARAIRDAQMRQATQRLSFEHTVPDDKPPIPCHSIAMTRAFANLFRNAAEARPDAHVRISYAWDDGWLTCGVEDDGPGFPTDVLNCVATLSGSEEHLGLALVSGCVQAHGGTVALSNRPDGGARVTLRLPLATAPASVRTVRAPTCSPSRRSGMLWRSRLARPRRLRM